MNQIKVTSKFLDSSVLGVASGRTLKIETNQPGMEMYTRNNLKEDLGLFGGRSS